MKKSLKSIAVILCIAMLFTVMPISVIAAANEQTEESDGIKIGDCITLGTYLGESIVWRCVSIDENGPLMLSEKILCLKAFDANGTDNAYHSDGWGWIRNNYGSNCWSDSNLRQWLNSSETQITWSHCSPITARVKGGYNAYDSEQGFLCNFTQAELSQVKTVTQRSYLNSWEIAREGYWDGGTEELMYWPSSTDISYDIYWYQDVEDKFFLLNPSQVDDVYQYSPEYLYKAYPTQAAVNNSDYSNDKLSAELPWNYWLGIPRNEGASYESQTIAYGIDEEKIWCGACYDGTIGVRPAFYLNTNNAKIEDGFNFYMNLPSNYINVGNTAKLNVGYYLNGTIDSSSTKYIYTISDSNTISVVNNGWSAECGQELLITGKNEGSSTITVTNPDTGESSALEIFVSSNESGWNFYNIPKIAKEEGKVTNFYNYGGMVVDEFSYQEHKDSSGNSDYYTVTMNIYNSNNLYGAVTSYRADGSIAGYCIIDKKSDYDTSFVDSCKSLYYSFGDLYYLIKNKSYYSGKSISKDTNVEIIVPVGGYLSISNNISTSEVANLANFCGLVVDMATLIGDFADMKSDGDLLDDVKITVIKDIVNDFISRQFFNKDLLKTFEKTLIKEFNDFNINNVQGFINSVSDKFLKKFGMDLVDEIEKKLYTLTGWASTGESMLKKVLPTGWLISLLYSFSEGCDFALFLNQYCKSHNKPAGINIYAPTDTTVYRSNGVKVNADTMSDDTVVHAYTVVDDGIVGIGCNTFPKETSYYSEKYQTYNITLYKNGVETQPDSSVTVQIPLPSRFNSVATKVYRNNDDGTLTDMNAYVLDGYIFFETNHFSYYSIVDESDPVLSDSIKFSGASLTLHNNMEINYKISEDLLDTGYINLYVKFVLNDTEMVISDYTVSDNRIVFNYSNIIPNQIDDIIYATIYAELDGTVYKSETKEYSVAQYCYNMLNKYSTDEYTKLRTLLVDLLNYGAESQIYTDYRTDSLVNASLTAEQAAWGTCDAPVLHTVQDTAYQVIDSPTVTWKGAGLNLQDSVTMRFKLAAESIDGLTVQVTSESGEWTIGSSAFEQTTGGYYVFFDGLNAGQMSEAVYITVYNGDNAVSNTIRYSIESYAYSKQNSADIKLGNLLSAMMKYGNAAYSYTH